MNILQYKRILKSVSSEFAECENALCIIAKHTLEARINVTAIRDEPGVLSKHIADSLYAARVIKQLGAKTVLDVGSGGGFPALPIAAALPDVSVTALDATAKKCRHIEQAALDASLSNVRVVCARAEEASDLFASFDVVISRAVAALPILLEITSPHAKTKGHILSMKGELAEREQANAAHAAESLGLTFLETVTYTLPEGGDHRAIIIYRKEIPTPKLYPRKWNEINKKPL